MLNTNLHNYFDQTDETRTARFKAGLVTKSNVAIASAITAYARISLTNHMMDPDNPVFYHDTDSIVLQHPLPDQAVGIELGQMKLEYTVKAGVFAGPKLYALQTGGGKEVVKAKGYGSAGINFASLASLNQGVSLVVQKEYWSPEPLKGSVKTYTRPFTLKRTTVRQDILSSDYLEGLLLKAQLKRVDKG